MLPHVGEPGCVSTLQLSLLELSEVARACTAALGASSIAQTSSVRLYNGVACMCQLMLRHSTGGAKLRCFSHENNGNAWKERDKNTNELWLEPE